MIKMICKEIRNNRKNRVTDMLLYAISMSTLAISLIFMLCALSIRKSSWYQGAQEVAKNNGDTLIQDKGNMFVVILSCICIVVWIFVLCGMFLFIRHSVEREYHGNSIMEAMGYHHSTVNAINIFKQILIITIALVPSFIFEILIWFIIKKNEVFNIMFEYTQIGMKEIIKILSMAYGLCFFYTIIITILQGRKESKKSLKTRMQQEK